MYTPLEVVFIVFFSVLAICAFAPGVIVNFFPTTLKKLDLDD